MTYAGTAFIPHRSKAQPTKDEQLAALKKEKADLNERVVQLTAKITKLESDMAGEVPTPPSLPV